MEKLADYIDVEGAAQRLRALAEQLGATEFAQVRNLDFVFAPFELYPLAPLVRPPLPRIVAFATDMDGTSTTTEPLALHALEYMVRRVTGRLHKSQWPGLDPRLDYPHVIGNSNFRHTEFLLQRYGPQVNHSAFTRAFFCCGRWPACPIPVGDKPLRRTRGIAGWAICCPTVTSVGSPAAARSATKTSRRWSNRCWASTARLSDRRTKASASLLPLISTTCAIIPSCGPWKPARVIAWPESCSGRAAEG